MAGVSADAAAALVGCDALWGLGLSREELRLLAAELGSDVGIPLSGGIALGTERGELLTPLEASGAGVFHWVFAVSPHGLVARAVFQEYDRLRRRRPPDGERPAPEPMPLRARPSLSAIIYLQVTSTNPRATGHS